MMRHGGKTIASATIIHACLIGAASAQVVERDTKITGPRGNSVERQIRTERVGNVIDRQVTITRPGGTYRRETEIIAPGGFRGGPPVFVGGGPRVVIEPIIPIVSPGFSFFLGTAPPPPPPVFVGPGYPVYAGPPLPPPRPPDAVEIEIGNLKSIHSDHRRDSLIALGKYRDPRAIPAIVDRLKHDHEKEVRQAAAWALGEIGDPRGIVPLEVAAQVDKKAEVRAVASKALTRIPTEQPLHARSATHPSPKHSIVSQPQAKSWNAVANKSAGMSTSPRQLSNADDDVPPPNPTPVASPAPRSAEADFGYPKTSR